MGYGLLLLPSLHKLQYVSFLDPTCPSLTFSSALQETSRRRHSLSTPMRMEMRLAHASLMMARMRTRPRSRLARLFLYVGVRQQRHLFFTPVRTITAGTILANAINESKLSRCRIPRLPFPNASLLSMSCGLWFQAPPYSTSRVYSALPIDVRVGYARYCISGLGMVSAGLVYGVGPCYPYKLRPDGLAQAMGGSPSLHLRHHNPSTGSGV